MSGWAHKDLRASASTKCHAQTPPKPTYHSTCLWFRNSHQRTVHHSTPKLPSSQSFGGLLSVDSAAGSPRNSLHCTLHRKSPGALVAGPAWARLERRCLPSFLFRPLWSWTGSTSFQEMSEAEPFRPFRNEQSLGDSMSEVPNTNNMQPMEMAQVLGSLA